MLFILKLTTVVIVFLSVTSVTRADCFFDPNTGNEACTGLGIAARVGIGIGVVVLISLVFGAFGISRRRRIQRMNQLYVTNPSVPNPYGPQYNLAVNNSVYPPPPGDSPALVPQYPPPSHPIGHQPGQQDHSPPAGYNVQQYQAPQAPPEPPHYEYAPPPGEPPQKFA